MLTATLSIFLLALTAYGNSPQTNARATCNIAEHSILSWNATGETQVSNLDGVEVTCTVTPMRPLYPKAGESRDPLRVTAIAYELSDDGTRHEFPTEVTESGGGSSGQANTEFVEFMFLIKLPPDELDAEARRYIDRLQGLWRALHDETLPPVDDRKAMATLCEIIAQQRVGHFHLEFRITEGAQVRATDTADVEVVYKGHFAEVALPADAPSK